MKNHTKNNKAIVLIVDDSATNIQILAACLKENHYLKVATSGEQCLQMAHIDPQPDLILLDIEMPGMDGYEVCHHLKSDRDTSQIPVIFVTGKQLDNDVEHGLKLGAVDFISKPILPLLVSRRVNAQVLLKKQKDRLNYLAAHDQLTGVYNRYHMMKAAEDKIAQGTALRYPISLLKLDLDHFREVNSNFGHPSSDAILRAVARRLSQNNGEEDLVARFGEDEFLLLLVQCDLREAYEKANLLREMIEELNPYGINITVSIAVAELEVGRESLSDILKRLDVALYQAKVRGHNRVVVNGSH